jgi:hypothetical protein
VKDATQPGASAVRVLYIGGTGRTGSTLLEKLLGQVEGVFACGEMAYLWHGLRIGSRCSCGAPLRECVLWTEIFDRAFGGMTPELADEMHTCRQSFRSVHLPLMLIPGATRRLTALLGPYPERIGRLYRAISEVTGASLLVDSSKEPHYSSILRGRHELDVRFAHLVRDPRAVAFSWGRSRREPALEGDAMMERRGPAVSAAFYDVSNLAAEALWRRNGWCYVRIRYEDLVTDPTGSGRMLSALTEIDLEPGLRRILDGEGAVVQATNSVWGNPNRFETGRIELRPDDAWKRSMARRARWTSTALTAPFIRRYGYAWSASD